MKRKGFTLIELIAVIAIMGVIITIVLPNIFNYADSLKTSSYNNLVDTIENDTKLFVSRHKDEISSKVDTDTYYIVTLQQLVDDNILKSPITDPRDDSTIPLTKKVYVTKKNNTSFTVCYEDNDCGFTNPNAPTLSLVGTNYVSLNRYSSYTDAGATATDDQEGDITNRIISTGTVNTNVPGTYTVTYTVKDHAGNTSTMNRTVSVIDYSYVYDYTGNYQTFTVPYTGIYKMELWGAQGGNSTYNRDLSGGTVYGGTGGYTSGSVYLTQGQVLYVYVGGKGGTGAAYTGISTLGGYNGGAVGGRGDTAPNQAGGGGGGATDIRLTNTNKYRYIRDYVNGSSANGGDHWVEIQAVDKNGNNVAAGKTVIGSIAYVSGYPYTRVTDGSTDTTLYADAGVSGLQYVEVDLGQEYDLSAIKVWHYYSDGRSYYNTKTILYNADRSISETVFDSATSGTYAETSTGKTSNASASSLRSRIMVAGGGGGTSNWNNAISGGTGGGLTGSGGILNSGSVSHTLAGGGTQTAGGNAGGDATCQLGSSGIFGAGGATGITYGGGGGGGYYGGGGSGCISNGVSSGGGGSSFISGYSGSNAVASASSTAATGQAIHYSGLYFTNGVMLNGSYTMPSTSGSTENGHNGNGYAKITFVSPYNFEYGYTGSTQTFTAPTTGKYKIELWGASGPTSIGGGPGSYTKGTITLNQNDNLYVYVGDVGKVNTVNVGGVATFNGGGAGGYGYSASYAGGGSGGGATDVRLTSGTWSDTTSLRSRIMVAAGGGGGTLCLGGIGYGGGTQSNDVYSTNNTYLFSTKATQTTGNAFGIGQTGVNAIVAVNCDAEGRGGGGGGYWGGKSAPQSSSIYTDCAGGGGSSFISGFLGCTAIDSSGNPTSSSIHFSGKSFINTMMYAGNSSMTSPTGSTELGHSGTGYARITYIGS